MTAEKITLTLIRGTIAELPQEEQAKVNSAVEKIRAVMATEGDYARFAIALIGAEMAAE